MSDVVPPLRDLLLSFAGARYVVLVHEPDAETGSHDVTVHLLLGLDGRRFVGAGVWNPFTRRLYQVPVRGHKGLPAGMAKAVERAVVEAMG